MPGFDAKGIETVRRDTCPAVAKTMERSLRLLFATRDLSEVISMPSFISVALGDTTAAVTLAAAATVCWVRSGPSLGSVTHSYMMISAIQ